jgi:hypothetical protein
MKYIILILFINLAIFQELQVEGDLTVSGNINSAVIDSLQAEIENLQNLLSESSGAIKTRIIDFGVSFNINEYGDMGMFVPLNELVGNVNNWYKIIPLYNDIDVNTCGADFAIYPSDPNVGSQDIDVSYGQYRYYFDRGLEGDTNLPLFILDSIPKLFIIGDLNASNCSGTITLLITSEN